MHLSCILLAVAIIVVASSEALSTASVKSKASTADLLHLVDNPGVDHSAGRFLRTMNDNNDGDLGEERGLQALVSDLFARAPNFVAMLKGKLTNRLNVFDEVALFTEFYKGEKEIIQASFKHIATVMKVDRDIKVWTSLRFSRSCR